MLKLVVNFTKLIFSFNNRIKNSYPLNYTKKDIFDCWFHHKKSWADLTIVENMNKNKPQVNHVCLPNEAQLCKKYSLLYINKNLIEETILFFFFYVSYYD